MNWFYMDGQKKTGPVTKQEIDQMVSHGKITHETLVWNEINSKWQPYGTLKSDGTSMPSEELAFDEILPDIDAGPDPEKEDSKNYSYCDECGRGFPDEEMINYNESKICAGCKEIFFQKIKEGVALPGMMEYAGFWIRLAAKMIDGIIVGMVSMVLYFVLIVGGLLGTGGFSAAGAGDPFGSGIMITFMVLYYILSIAIPAAYTTFFLGKFAATPGKMACSLRVVLEDGTKVSYSRSFGRHFAEWLSALTIYIGYIMAAFDDEKRTLHDRVCNTRVIKK